MPSIKKTPLQFLKDVLIGKKDLLKTEAIDRVERPIPRYTELSVKNFWKLVKTRSDLKLRFPDYREGVFPEKFYLYDVLNTLEDACITKLIAQCKELREGEEIKVKNEEETERVLEVTEKYMGMFMNSSKTSKERGKALDFIQRKAKPRTIPRKKKFTTELISFEKVNLKRIKI